MTQKINVIKNHGYVDRMMGKGIMAKRSLKKPAEHSQHSIILISSYTLGRKQPIKFCKIVHELTTSPIKTHKRRKRRTRRLLHSILSSGSLQDAAEVGTVISRETSSYFL